MVLTPGIVIFSDLLDGVNYTIKFQFFLQTIL